MRAAALALPIGLLCGLAEADEIVLPPAMERGGTVEATYRPDRPATGRATLRIEWTDALGRVVDRRSLDVMLDGGTAVKFSLDLRRAVAMQNTVAADLTVETADGPRTGSARTSFIAKPDDDPWSDYQIIMWQGENARQFAFLKQIGVSAGITETDHRDEAGRFIPSEVEPLLATDLRWYVENIATDFYAAYHRWSGDRPPNWRYRAVRERFAANPADPAAYERDPSLSDPAWLDKIARRLVNVVTNNRPYRPLYYNLGDETGIADLTAFWDFDFSGVSLAEMRLWLERHYGGLAALNAEWGTTFARWDDVMPMKTADAMRRKDGNFAAWADFKAFMDAAFARAIERGSDAIHAADPKALSAIEGGQVPGWGGYDYTRLARAVDLLELYDYGETTEIVHSLNPKAVLLTTQHRGGAAGAELVWRELLRGERGVVLWDAKGEFVNPDGTPGPRGREAARYFPVLRGGLGALLVNSTPQYAPIAVLYSPASMRTQWMLDWQPKGDDWLGLDASSAYDPNVWISAVVGYWSAAVHAGFAPRFVSPAEVAAGELERQGERALLLPHAVALSPAEAAAIRRFAEAGGLVIADTEPGRFDEHSRKAPRPLLSDLFAAPDGAAAAKDRPAYFAPKLRSIESELVSPQSALQLRSILEKRSILPDRPLATPAGRPVTDVERHIFQDGDVTIMSLQRDFDPPPDQADSTERVVLPLPGNPYVYDLRRRRPLGRREHLLLGLDLVEPAILALSPRALPGPTVAAPQALAPGDTAELKFGLTGPADSVLHVFHVEVERPDGTIALPYSGNLLARGGSASRLLPLALNDPPGRWTVRVTDLPGGGTATAEILVTPR